MSREHGIMVRAICGIDLGLDDLKYVNESLGRYVGGFYDEWRWDRNGVAKLSLAELNALYDILVKPEEDSDNED